MRCPGGKGRVPPGLQKAEHCQQFEEGDSSALLSNRPTWSAGSSSESLRIKNTLEKIQQMKMISTGYMNRNCEGWIWSAWNRERSGELQQCIETFLLLFETSGFLKFKLPPLSFHISKSFLLIVIALRCDKILRKLRESDLHIIPVLLFKVFLFCLSTYYFYIQSNF